MVTVAIAACARSLALLGRCNDMTLETIAYFFGVAGFRLVTSTGENAGRDSVGLLR